MKKTLIALMALAGVACGENYTTPATTNPFAEALMAVNYEYGMDYTLTFTIGSSITGSHGGLVLTLATNDTNVTWSLFSQQGQYVGLDNGNNGVGSGLVDGYANVYTYNNISEGTDGWFMDSGAHDGIGGYTLTIVGDSKADTTVLTFAKAGKNTVTMNINSMLDASQFNIGEKTSASNVSFMAIPEPTTATLSLLALAGLAARRRRH